MARWNFLACVILTSCLVSGQSPRYVLRGQKVTLKKDITGQPDNILWTHNGNKVVEFNGREERVYDPYKTRVTLDWSSAELDISDLRLEDSGKYELEVFVNNNLDKEYYDVEILDRVAKPTISCKINNSSNSGTLVCSAEPRQPVHLMKFEWHSQGNVHPGPHLQISLGDELDDQVYSCMVSNPLTTETASFTAKDCNTTKSSSVAIIAISLLLFIAVIIGTGIFCYCRNRKGSGWRVETDEVTPFIDGNSPSAHGYVKKMVSEIELKNTVGEKHIAEQHQRPIPGKIEFKQASGQSSTDHRNAEASSSSVPPSVASQKKDNSNKNTTVEDRLSEAPDKQEGHASNKLDSHAVSDDISQNTSSEQKFSTAPVSPDKKQHQPSDDSSVQKDSDVQQLNEPTEEEKKQDAALDQNSTDHQNTETSSSSVIPSDAANRGDRGAVEEQLSKSADEEKQQAELKSPTVVSPGRNKDDINDKNTTAANKQERPAESADVDQDTSPEQKSSTAPVSPDDPECSSTSGLQPAQNSTYKNVHHASEPSDESDDGHKDVSSERRSPTASDGSVSDQKSADHQNTETSPSSVPPSDAANRGDRGAVEEQLSESADEEKQQAELKSPTVVSPGRNKDDINDKNTTAANKQERPAESADVDQDTSPEQKSSTAPVSPVIVLDPSNTDKSEVLLENASDPAAVEPVTGPDSVCQHKNVHHASEPSDESDDGHKDVSSEGKSPTASDGSASDQKSADHQNAETSSSDAGQNKDDINDKNTTVDDCLSEGSDKQEGHASTKSESPAESADMSQDTSSEQKSSTAPASPDKVLDPTNTDKSDSDSKQSSKDPLENASDSAAVGLVTGPDSEPQSADKKQHQPSDDSSVQKDSDVQQLSEPTEEEKPQGGGDPERNDESDDGHKDVSSERRSPTASDGSASDQKSADHQNTEASSSDAGQNKDDINDKNTTVDDCLSEGSDKQEGHASTKSESPAESADMSQDTSSEQKSSTAPASPVLDPTNTDKSDSDSKQSSKDPLENASDSAAVGLVTGPDSEPQSAGSDKNKLPPSDDSIQNHSDDKEKQDAGDPEQNASVQNSTDHQNVEASSSSVPPPDADQTKDDINNKNTTVEDHLTEAPDKQEEHASDKSESPAESADVNQNTSSEQKSSNDPASPVLDPSNNDKNDSDTEQSSKVLLGNASDTAAVGSLTGPASKRPARSKKEAAEDEEA